MSDCTEEMFYPGMAYVLSKFSKLPSMLTNPDKKENETNPHIPEANLPTEPPKTQQVATPDADDTTGQEQEGSIKNSK